MFAGVIQDDAIRKAAKKALLWNTTQVNPPDWIDVRLQLRADLGETVGETYAMIILRTDSQRNVEVTFDGVSRQEKGTMDEPQAVMAELINEYDVHFVWNNIQNVHLPG